MQSVKFIFVLFSVNLLLISGEPQRVETEEDRKFLLPLLAVKPLIAAGLLAGSKLPLFFPKPGIEFTVVKHEAAPVNLIPSPPVQTPPPSNTPVPPPTTTQSPTSVNKCSSLNGFPCYNLPSGCVCLVSTQKPWVDAFNFCRANNRSLISIESAARQAELQTYLPLLIGQNNIFTIIGFWTSGIYCLTSYTWASIPQYFNYVNWLVGEPALTNLPRSSCVRSIPLQNYQWADVDCGQFLPFICE